MASFRFTPDCLYNVCRTREAVYKGLDDGEAFVDLLSGKAEGKVVVDMQ